MLGIAAVDDERIVIADTYNHKLKFLDLKNRRISTLAGTGAPGKGPEDGPASQMNEPGGVARSGWSSRPEALVPR